MPIPRLNKGTKQTGIQTHAKVKRLPKEFQGSELEYLSHRDWYSDQLAILAQFNEALEQAKKAGNKADIKEFSDRIYGINSNLTDYRQRVRDIGEASYASAFYLLAECMLAPEVFKAIDMATADILKRQKHELKP